MLPSTLDIIWLCTSKVCCYIPWSISRCTYRKIHNLTLTLVSRSHEMLPSTLDIMWPMHQQSLMMLHPKVKKNIVFTRKYKAKVTWNVAQCPLHHVTYAPPEFEIVVSSKGLGGDAFTRKVIIWPLTLTLGSMPNELLPSTLYIMWPIQLLSLKLLRQTV